MYLKTKKKIARTHENITFFNTISSGFAKPQEHTDGEMNLKTNPYHHIAKSLKDILITAAKLSGQKI